MCLICLGSRQVFLYFFCGHTAKFVQEKADWGNTALTMQNAPFRFLYVEVSRCVVIRLQFVRLQRIASGAQKTGIIYTFPVRPARLSHFPLPSPPPPPPHI